MNLGNTIKSIRKSKGMSQTDLAEKCGLSKNGLWNYENNNRTPTIATLIDIASALEIPLDRLLKDYISRTPKEIPQHKVKHNMLMQCDKCGIVYNLDRFHAMSSRCKMCGEHLSKLDIETIHIE